MSTLFRIKKNQIFREKSSLLKVTTATVAAMENGYDIELAVDIQSPSPIWGKAGIGAVRGKAGIVSVNAHAAHD
jgi:hypothetical protein